ncbi:sensor histidine kinase [Aliarcobacter cibarius]|uniref:histidine kinase n=1 Tax=Aliarcobacter cibarius TaxID=255507 RepID=A0A5J6RIT3_9BACT|nr:HAMP domain-containing sensor histidine kinase [Aliarcobacter cibarius]QEZ89297.1 two-component system sensor histidine kinase [Aliarcobacter cibarius]QKJ27330.1 two-component system sensor histidine kinase [Aliarcobacter cibarius]TLS95614.1 HAMP domain-containing histidine kinase [Aliarcobacter cibarius]TLS96152.1 HAMP domain-containing histidine kinase [Aliarcobacter cibarius]TLT02918.1 HAMP domain-containing histidine kinase [Aliarcobacter cibarius]
MNSKKVDFLISISTVFVFTLSVILYLNFLFSSKLSFTKEQYFVFLIILLLLGLFIFLLFSNSFIKSIFRSEEKLEKDIKNTIHELNIPASTIKMNVQLLKKNLKDEKDLARLDRISKANDNLLKLYENLEYEFKKEINKIELEQFFLEDIIKTSLDKFEDIKKDTAIEKDIKNHLLYTDYNGFLIVLDNLFSNAIKYNRAINPYIKVELKDTVLSIFNFGEKIDTKNIMLVFDRYFQENSQNSGFGLGLAIVKEFCDKHKILINIETLEDGTKINLNLKNIFVNKDK